MRPHVVHWLEAMLPRGLASEVSAATREDAP